MKPLSDYPLPPGQNGFLRSLSRGLFLLLQPHLEFVTLPLNHVIHNAGEPISFVYFLNDGLVSLLIESLNGKGAEIGVIGKEGIAGAPAALRLPKNPVTEIIQIAGHGYRMKATAIRPIVNENPELRELLNQHSSLLAMRIAQIAGCNALHNAEQRLARWLLTANDRVSLNPLPLTHEYLGLLLGITRPSVSGVLNALKRKRAIRLGRQSIEIVNRSALERCSCECYSVVTSLELKIPITKE